MLLSLSASLSLYSAVSKALYKNKESEEINVVKEKNQEFKKLKLFPGKECKEEINCVTKGRKAGRKEEKSSKGLE